MLTLILKRLLSIIPIGFIVVSIVGTMIHFVPGDPVDQIAGDYTSEKDKIVFRQKLGLDKPIEKQLINYYSGILHGDLGHSLITNHPVSEMISERILATLKLAFTAILIACLIGIPFGIFSAIRKNTWIDYFCLSFSMAGISMPSFWLGPLLILLFSVKLGWLPVSGNFSPNSIILPALTLSISFSSVIIRFVRTNFLEHLNADYIRTARSKGVSEWRILFKHVLKNTSLSLVTIVGLHLGILLTGTIITEKVFNWPGLGSLVSDAIERRDYPVVQGCVFLFSITFILINLSTDLFYLWLDPRIRAKS